MVALKPPPTDRLPRPLVVAIAGFVAFPGTLSTLAAGLALLLDRTLGVPGSVSTSLPTTAAVAAAVPSTAVAACLLAAAVVWLYRRRTTDTPTS